jgi:hypothetical protein
MIGKKSGLSAENIAELLRWSDMFNRQVHGAHFSTMREVFSWIQDKKEFAVGPRMDDDACAMYMNRFTEIAWMTLRSLPFLQTEIVTFDDAWRHQWEVLDEALRASVVGLGDLGKKIAPAFIDMIDEKFATSPDTRYAERGALEGGTAPTTSL